ncbi:hypothetical protein [Hymenobacter guriensis]|uniref:Uncharacterized protein n=1 Tax=Hymenobacter guriensis TaxID=2793065 RepID=A0ABS0L3L6_9BACT|nr:hypothetical protein [Hymenobacter guriensis]MBG8554158.1 hypothetical protein [Hymenobacter guriensis]
MSFYRFALLLLLVVALPVHGRAQWAVTNWIETRLDEHMLVELPYVTSAERDSKTPGTQVFTTETENIILMAGSVDLRYNPNYNPNGFVTVESLNKYFNRLIRRQCKALRREEITLLTQGNLVFADSPARAARFIGRDEERNKPVYLDLIYLWRGEVIYFFACAYRLPETADTIKDRQRFLHSVVFDGSIPPREF